MLPIPRLIKHDQYVEALCETLEPRYDVVLKHVPIYSRKRRLLGEVDVIAVKAGACDIYEVKCSYRIVKARRQLRKLGRLLHRTTRVRNLFFFCGESQRLFAV